ncbi:MAG: MBL fold metallo-hydrolase [Spirulinaceae cyanobacterium]
MFPSSLRCHAYGVGQEGEGVCLLLELGPHRVLLDCGLRDLTVLQSEVPGQGNGVASEDRTPAFDFVFCSHAHPDHSRGLRRLRQTSPELPIYLSAVTATLLEAQSGQALNVQVLPWRSPLQLPHSTLQVQLLPAGHLPGAAALLLTYSAPERTYTLLYTGDFCRTNLRLTEGLNLESLRGAAPDVLIAEGSYGMARYPHRRQQEQQLLAQLERELGQGRAVLLLTPPLGLAQELLILLRSHHHFTGRDLDIWVDEPIARFCDAYLELLPHLPIAIQNFARHQELFWDAQVLPRSQRLPIPGAPPPQGDSPMLLLSDRLPDWLWSPEQTDQNWCCFVPQRELNQLVFDPEQLRSLPWSVIPYGLTDHSDGTNTLQLIHTIRPQHIVLIHGSPRNLAQLTNETELQNRYQLHCPRPQTTVELPLGDRFVQPALPAPSTYTGEVTESDADVMITLPPDLTTAPQWANFANTGIITARWQGNDLCLRGLSQRQLLEQLSSPAPEEIMSTCARCQYYQPPHCQNLRSPLYQRLVSPEGSCPLFEEQ